jgi:hypothetical protein
VRERSQRSGPLSSVHARNLFEERSACGARSSTVNTEGDTGGEDKGRHRGPEAELVAKLGGF